MIITIRKVNIMRNEKGIIALAVILSMLLAITALAVFSVVSGRFGISYSLNNRIQALRDAESASFVTYQMMRDGTWDTPADITAPATQTYAVTFLDTDGAAARQTSAITVSDVDVKAKVAY